MPRAAQIESAYSRSTAPILPKIVAWTARPSLGVGPIERVRIEDRSIEEYFGSGLACRRPIMELCVRPLKRVLV